jgi:NADH dehydrogenase
VILGAGFGGLYCALELERGLARDGSVEVTLVNRENFVLFTPMLHEVAASDLDLTHIVNPIRKLLRRVRFFEGDVESIDLERRSVRVSHGEGHHDHELPYDHLVLALGSVTNFFGMPGLAERALTMKSLGDAIALRNRLIEQLEEADFECSAGSRDHLLGVVVAGGGFAGVETIAGVNDFLREALRFYPHLREEHLRLVLVHPGEVILPELDPRLGAYAQRKLAARGVEIRTRTRVSGVTPDAVDLSDGTRVPAATLVWTAGTSPNPLLDGLGCRKERGRIVVDEHLRVPDRPGLWALGDCAYVPDRRRGGAHPPTAQHALRQGRVLARNLQAQLRGGALRAFDFTTLGQLAAIGRRTGVANVLGLNFSGFLAWLLWRSIYLSKLPRFEKKLRVALDWTLDLLFAKDLVQFQTFRSAGVSHGEPGVAVPAAPIHAVSTLEEA